MTNLSVDSRILSVAKQHGPLAIRDLKRLLPNVEPSQLQARVIVLREGGYLEPIGENSQRRYAVAER